MGKLWLGIVVLIAGVLFLLRDLNVWNFWNIQWYTVAFVLIGIKMLFWCCCKECKETPKKK